MAREILENKEMEDYKTGMTIKMETQMTNQE